MANLVVIGGGVVGISCALELLADGHEVTVLDRDPPGEGAGWASCGSIAVSEIIPLSKPGTLLRAPGWLLDPTGPLTLRLGSALSLLPWFLRFASNSRMSRIKAISADLSALTLSALADTERFLATYKLQSLLRKTPVIEVYDSPEELDQERGFHDMRRAFGFQIDEISGNEAAEMEPALARDFACATVFQDWRSVVDTKRYVLELHKAFADRGGIIKRDEAIGFTREGNQVTGVKTKYSTFPADQIVVAAGAWSKQFAAMLGLKLQLEGVIGYQTSLPTPGVDVIHGLVYAKGGFGITPYESGLAISGSIEFARLSAPPDWERADVLVEKARRVIPGLRTGNGQKRIGRRPLTPDTKPIIGRTPKVPNAILATGHGQLGLTLAATTGRLVTDIIANRNTNIDMNAYRPDRF